MSLDLDCEKNAWDAERGRWITLCWKGCFNRHQEYPDRCPKCGDPLQVYGYRFAKPRIEPLRAPPRNKKQKCWAHKKRKCRECFEEPPVTKATREEGEKT